MSIEGEALRKLIVQYKDPNKSEKDAVFNRSELITANELLSNTQVKENIDRARKLEKSTPLSDNALKLIVTDALGEIGDIEEAARSPDRWKDVAQTAANTKLIVDFSAPGSYYMPQKDDRWKSDVLLQVLPLPDQHMQCFLVKNSVIPQEDRGTACR